MKKAIFTIALLAVSVSPAFADVEPTCTANWGGSVECEFHNTGTKPDSVCLEMVVTRNKPSDRYTLSSLGGEGAILKSGEICSGLVQPKDIRERKPSVAWRLESGPSLTPQLFCTSDNPWLKPNLICDFNQNVI